ncbi:uncharacterized protein GVI51_I07139 [Nakaseomyces glabratus]|uniref:Uncharacterized protein n=2 Tax=Candida glabrata TaxID=5478 RepID=Q6FQC6_CANGA|nr:uncharacterized protein CAGL0I07315g [Nakaseomyces glabratus]KAH7584995.1 Haloacid dehalogenase-like hydrolase [Nakaseomyces glabratus]KAH7586551.1 Haloacid dehalogenase-like hydrolase [Nakaseomyces glabratus]KAH7590399.1 Haloacid dehalogenase-like hydrolase [Nakaseomyces glabratus]KAH7598653.1 Haloacid dehalogenase-like hydrolase [Nakaseomyces glabratus]KAH7599827.1 Haloacid dehalogenase-like hydrolase [Nakaseomyces glabratus]|eukprot:XP_447568.1 uncharacterized protein CAGL0I07315g [[Candida] glabrata]
MVTTKLRTFSKLPKVAAVIFDMDGTLCLPQPWMFPAMREAIGLKDASQDILDFISMMDDPVQQKIAEEGLAKVEEKAMLEMIPQPGLVETMKYLTQQGIAKNICTRNVGTPVHYFIDKFIPKDYAKFDHIIMRDFRPTKPYPDPLLHIAKQIDSNPQHIIMVGDSYDDMKSGRLAGCLTVLLKNKINAKLVEEQSSLIDVTISELNELIEIIEEINN